MARALRHRNLRLFFAGQGTSLVGTWLTKFATSWMAYRLTGSPLMLGLVAFFNHAPTSLMAPIAGVLVDRWNRRRTIIATQVAACLQSAALAVFALAGWMTVWHLMVLGAIQGVINAFDMPARQSFLRELIDDPADLPNAIALNSSMVNVAKMVGPALAAVLVGLVGEGWCFAIDAASYIAVLGSLVAIRVARPSPVIERGRVRDQLLDGLRYVRRTPLVRAVLILLAVVSLLAGAYMSMLPVVAAEHLGGGPYTLGVLMAAGGLGALTGALYLANRTTVVGLGGVLARSSLVLGLALLSLELARWTWLAAPILFVVGLCLMVQLAATNTIIQTIADPTKLGRVMSLYAMAFTGAMPIGAFLHGSIASRVGAVHSLAGAGALCVVAALAFRRALPALRIASRPRYIELGLIPSTPVTPP
ncbi:MAG: MFS transporter [Myxococcales bacterium]|nr:MFS transporter [Myxococcales bacterium]